MDALFKNDFEHNIEEQRDSAIKALNNEIKTGKKKL